MYGLLGEFFRNVSALSKGRSGLLVWWNAELSSTPVLTLWRSAWGTEGPRSWKCSGNLWTKFLCSGVEMCYSLVSFQRFLSGAHVHFREDAFIFCRVYNSTVPWLRTLPSIPAVQHLACLGFPYRTWSQSSRSRDWKHLWTEQLEMNLMYLNCSLYFPCLACWFSFSHIQTSEWTKPCHKTQSPCMDRTNLSVHHLSHWGSQGKWWNKSEVKWKLLS